MPDADYIRKAVDLIDTDEYPWDYYKMADSPLPREQFILDAIAAQLVRQVDALPDTGPTKDDGEIVVWVEKGATDIIERNTVGIHWCKDLLSISSPDRTMNTIKVIVGSGVLDGNERQQKPTSAGNSIRDDRGQTNG